MTGLIPAYLAEVMAAHDRAREAAERFINALMDDFDARWITGNGTGEPRGFMPDDRLEVRMIRATPPIPVPEWLRQDLDLPEPEPEPTPAEKAMAILAPHLVNEPLYQSTGTTL